MSIPRLDVVLVLRVVVAPGRYGRCLNANTDTGGLEILLGRYLFKLEKLNCFCDKSQFEKTREEIRHDGRLNLVFCFLESGDERRSGMRKGVVKIRDIT